MIQMVIHIYCVKINNNGWGTRKREKNKEKSIVVSRLYVTIDREFTYLYRMKIYKG